MPRPWPREDRPLGPLCRDQEAHLAFGRDDLNGVAPCSSERLLDGFSNDASFFPREVWCVGASGFAEGSPAQGLLTNICLMVEELFILTWKAVVVEVSKFGQSRPESALHCTNEPAGDEAISSPPRFNIMDLEFANQGLVHGHRFVYGYLGSLSHWPLLLQELGSGETQFWAFCIHNHKQVCSQSAYGIRSLDHGLKEA